MSPIRAADPLHELGRQVAAGKSVAEVFPGIGSVQFESDGVGPRINLRISKVEGVPVTIVPEGTPGAGVVALKRVDELGFYHLSHKNVEEKLGFGQYSVTAAIAVLGLKYDLECSKLFKLGAVKVHRYSPKALGEIKALFEEKGEQAVRAQYREILKNR